MANGDGTGDTRTAIGKMLRDSVIPKLVEDGSRRNAAPAQKPTTRSIVLDSKEVDETVYLLLDGKDSVVIARADELLAQGHSVTDLILGYLGAIAERLGAFWVRDLCSFADVTLGMATLHAILRSKAGLLASEVEGTDNSPSILITTVPGQTHVFGASVVEEFFRAAGWDVSSGFYETEAECLEAVSSDAFDIVGLSIGAERSVEDCRRFIGAIRDRSMNKDAKILVGGPLLAVDPDQVATLGADASAPDAPSALKTARKLIEDGVRSGVPQ
ncbi:MAG: cobalamin B12-binding domain-containing protein [Pseudomonadota bacterium]